VRTVLVLLAAALVAVAAAGAYRNPTPGRALVLQIPRMHLAKVQRNVVYRRSPRLRMDVYRPRAARGRLPAVLLGGPPGFGKDSAQKLGWAQLIAASGMAAVAFDFRSDGDVSAAIAYVRAHARRLGIDRSRACTLGLSTGAASAQLSATMPEPGRWLRCNVVYYASLDSALTHLRANPAGIPSMLIVKAGRDENAGINDSIDRFEAAARALHSDVRVITNATARHGFDLGPRTARTRAILRETLRYLRARLAKPFPLTDPCLSRAQRASALRFFASDDTPLAGVEVGTGPAGIVLAHGYQGNLCDWLPYAQELAASGYRVLAYDARAGLRVDLDAEAAIEALRRAGARRVAIAGSSLGALAAVIAGAAPPTQPDAVVSLSAPSDFGPLRGLDAAARLRIPAFFLAAEDNHPFSDDARSLYAAATLSPERRLEVVPGAAHGSDLLQDPSLRAAVWSFIAAHTR
jgi:dienelactone hydrolase